MQNTAVKVPMLSPIFAAKKNRYVPCCASTFENKALRILNLIPVPNHHVMKVLRGPGGGDSRI